MKYSKKEILSTSLLLLAGAIAIATSLVAVEARLAAYDLENEQQYYMAHSESYILANDEQ